VGAAISMPLYPFNWCDPPTNDVSPITDISLETLRISAPALPSDFNTVYDINSVAITGTATTANLGTYNIEIFT
jgi:hypothetical protein